MLIAAESLIFPDRYSAVLQQRCFSIPHYLALSQDNPLVTQAGPTLPKHGSRKSISLKSHHSSDFERCLECTDTAICSLCCAKELQTREGFLWQSLGKSENIPIHFPLSINWPKPPPAAQASAELLGRGIISSQDPTRP